MNPHMILSLAHIFALAPLLVIIAKTNWIPPMVVAFLGAFIALYHAYKAYTKISAGSSIAGTWINLFHALVVGPVIIAHGLNPDVRYLSEFILMFAFAAVGYHTFYLIQD